MVKVKRKRALKSRIAPGSRCENFVPWVPDNTDGPQDLEEEELMEKRAGCLIAMLPEKEVAGKFEWGIGSRPCPICRTEPTDYQ